ncbi:MAG: hypothetical protein QG583_141 [Patescibacteria group bacterium]|nr:hypothetical protein [Patescibacteria group bacterium]
MKKFVVIFLIFVVFIFLRSLLFPRIGGLEIFTVKDEKNACVNIKEYNQENTACEFDNKKLVVPLSSIIYKKGESYVCKITFKKSALSMDYQYYKVWAVLKKIEIEGDSVVQMPSELAPSYFREKDDKSIRKKDKFLVVSSGLEEGEEIERFGVRFPPKENRSCLKGDT